MVQATGDSRPYPSSAEKELDYVVTSHSIYTHYGWSQIQTITHTDHNQFWEWLEGEGWIHKRLHLYARNAADGLTLLRFWDRIEAYGVMWGTDSKSSVTPASNGGHTNAYSLHRRITSQRVTIVDYSRGDHRYLWTSLTQYLQMSWREIAQMCDYKEYDEYGEISWPNEADTEPANSSVLTVRAMQLLTSWWRSHKGGPWAPSIGSLSARFLRSRLPARLLCTHMHTEALQLEREACYGGRVSCWYVGDVAGSITISPIVKDRPPRTNYLPVPGPAYVVDVRSMYPALLATRQYPVKLIGYERGMTTADLSDLLRYVCCIACVSIQTDRAEYPYRRDDSVYYPTGHIVTVLAGPELRFALDHNHITRIHRVALYQSGTPFVGAASELLAARQIATDRQNSGVAAVVKCISNAMSGTLAQRITRWIACPGTATPLDEFGEKIRWGNWMVSTATQSGGNAADADGVGYVTGIRRHGGRSITRYRATAGLVERLERSDTGTGTLQACYAYLTAYGRSLMRDIRSVCTERSVIMQDTDGLWVTEAGYDALVSASQIGPGLPGELRMVRRIQLARIYGPKHYWADGVWTLSGMADPVYCEADGTYTYHTTTNPIRGSPLESPHTIREYTRTCDGITTHLHGVQGDDGWISPYYIGGSYERPEVCDP